MSTRGIQMSRRFALLASLTFLGGLIPGFGNRPVAAAQIAAAPEAPDTLEAFPADREPIKIGLIWDDNSSNETGFEVERRIYKSENEFEKIGGTGANQTQFVDGNIRNNIQYEYRVRAVNGDGASGYTNSAIAFFGTPGKIKVEPTKIEFGVVRPGAVRTRKFTIRNTGRSNLTVNVALVDGGGPFAITEGGGEIDIEAGNSARVTVQYAPTQNGRDSAQIAVTLEDLELRVRLRGQAGNSGGGGRSKIRVSPIPVDFGNVRVGTTRTRQFTIRNTGQVPAAVTISEASGKPFSIVSGGGDVEIAPGSSHKVSVSFSPTSVGRAVGVATVTLDKSQVQVQLKGFGVSGGR